ncbi:MAG: 23S rRNA (guanosine(2251)-2'-O)-methyltransferase RlmB [Bifidobacteriaceae bacterium]|jgi:23S rRNA (guanosine2251-2'-O)-methyltransferase|nr:23S rRNA (guanosine(2251)-2'-O)-methyltransferase RlmB [Bifidobacteriaceae bacterium]
MAGNSKPRGAVRKPGSKKGPTVGSGGKGRRALEGRGPTPKAEDRPYHPAAKRKAVAQARAAARPKGGGRGRGGPGAAPGPRGATAGADYVVGRNSVLEALQAGVPALHLELAPRVGSDDRIKDSLALAAQLGLPILEAGKPELDRRTGGAHHQGIALKVAPYRYAAPGDLLRAAWEADQPPLIVALDSVTDPHNLGAVLRSAGAFGVHGVVVPQRRSAPMGATAWKVSAGAAARVPVAQAPNLVRALEAYQAEGLFVVGLDAAGTVDVADLPVANGPLVIVTGSEGKGLSRLVRQACDLTAAIPIDATTESLNAAVATGIVLYEVAKARRSQVAP